MPRAPAVASRSGSGTSGALGSAPPSARSTPSTERTSSSAVLLVSLMLASASAAFSGCLSMRCSPTPACTLIWLSECASTSCSSRAMRTRSACTSVCRRSAHAAAELGGALAAGAHALADAEDDQDAEGRSRDADRRPLVAAEHARRRRSSRPTRPPIETHAQTRAPRTIALTMRERERDVRRPAVLVDDQIEGCRRSP